MAHAPGGYRVERHDVQCGVNRRGWSATRGPTNRRANDPELVARVEELAREKKCNGVT
jgi:hypothetical protein